jgi:hypothetical protein
MAVLILGKVVVVAQLSQWFPLGGIILLVQHILLLLLEEGQVIDLIIALIEHTLLLI